MKVSNSLFSIRVTSEHIVAISTLLEDLPFGVWFLTRGYLIRFWISKLDVKWVVTYASVKQNRYEI